MRIRRAESMDAERLAAFAAHTFTYTFGAANRPEDLDAFLEETYGVAQQTRELEDPDVVTILIEDDARLAAFAQVRRGSRPACVEEEDAVELWRFYVHREWHGRGVAQLLMAEAMRAARELGGGAMWLSVWQRNPRAIAFYARQGFVVKGEAEFRVGTDVQTDHIMARALDVDAPAE